MGLKTTKTLCPFVRERDAMEGEVVEKTTVKPTLSTPIPHVAHTNAPAPWMRWGALLTRDYPDKVQDMQGSRS